MPLTTRRPIDDMVLHRGKVYIQMQPSTLFEAFEAALCGPVLQLFPPKGSRHVNWGRKSLSSNTEGWEIDLSLFVEVGLETVPIDASESGVAVPLWIFVLSHSSREVDDDQNAAAQSSNDEETKRYVLGTVKQEDAVQWTLQLKRAVRSVLNAKNLQSDVRNRSLSEVVDGQFQNSIASHNSIHALQNVTQLQRNIAIMGLKEARKDEVAEGGVFKPFTHAQARVRAISNIMLSNNHSNDGRRTWGQIKKGTSDTRISDDNASINSNGNIDDDSESEWGDDINMSRGLREVKDREEQLRSKFIVKRGGNIFLFWGRTRIRTTSIVRLFMILVAYPFVVIYSVLDLDKLVTEVKLGRKKIVFFGFDVSFLFKNARHFVVSVNLVLLSGPILLVYGVLRTLDQTVGGDFDDDDDADEHNVKMQLATTAAVGVYSFVYLSPIAVAIIRKIRTTSNQVKSYLR